jgi:hypothetical protein
MKKIILLLSLTLLSSVLAAAQQRPKVWTEWSKKDAEKILNGSAWAQTQDDTDTSEMMYSPTSDPTITKTSSNSNASRDLTSRGRDESGAKNTPLSMRYRVRFFSAKPIREAFARMIVLQQQNADEGKLRSLAEKMQGWIDADLGDIIVLAVTVEATDRRLSGPVEQALRSATAETLKGKCYLERNDGKRVEINIYEQPTADQTGAKFVFARSLDGQPFITPETESVRFVAEFNDKIKVNRKYKVSEMMYNGKLEF